MINDSAIFSGIKKYYLNLYADIWHLIKVNRKEGRNLNDYVTQKPETKKFGGQKFDEYFLKIDKVTCKDHFDMMIDGFDAFDVRDRAEFYQYIKTFGNILFWAERILLYQNDDTKDAYSSVDEDSRISAVCFNFDDISVTISYTESSINLPNKAKDNPLNFMSDEDVFTTFVEITITRNFGNNLVTNVKTVLGSNEFGLSSDEGWLLELVENKICNLATYSLKDIANHIINNCCGLTNFNIEDIENGTTIWRPITG